MNRRLGRATRGKTAPQRLRRTDTFIAIDGVLRRSHPRYLDIGFGEDATTVIEAYERLGPTHPTLHVVGIEIDRVRVAAALPFAVAGSIEFAHGGFEAAERHGPAGVIRAMNVLRQYHECDHAAAVATMAKGLAPDGVLLEGTSSPSGRLLCANVYRRGGDAISFDGLLFAPNPRRSWNPRELQTVLPKNWIHQCEPGSTLDTFFEVFERSVAAARRADLDSAAVAKRVVGDLDDAGYRCDRRPALVRRSLFVVRDPVGLGPPLVRT